MELGKLTNEIVRALPLRDTIDMFMHGAEAYGCESND
jgi:hypothetical protein